MYTGAVQLLWKEWAVQMLVLVSFFLQVFLFVFAGMRWRSSSTTLRIALWLAYLLADSTATYTLGHLSIATSSPEHQLVAFWAPFLILHLGGQDAITAYAIEDNRLWLRHLQTLAVQVAAAAYVLHNLLLVGGSRRLVAAAILMFVVGVLKYGERIWALKCADNDGLYTFIRNYYYGITSTESFRSPHEPPLHGMQLVRRLREGDENERIISTTITRGAQQAKKVLNMGRDGTRQLQAVFGIWVEILCYAGKHGSRDSHARRLSNGGEFLTVVWILTGHLAFYEQNEGTYDLNQDVETDATV